MRITESQLRRIIRQEVRSLREAFGPHTDILTISYPIADEAIKRLKMGDSASMILQQIIKDIKTRGYSAYEALPVVITSIREKGQGPMNRALADELEALDLDRGY